MRKDCNKTKIIVLNFTKKEISRRELDKIVDDWLQATSELGIGTVKEESLQCIVMILTDYEILARCDTVLALILKNLCVAQKEDNLPMLALIVLEGD